MDDDSFLRRAELDDAIHGYRTRLRPPPFGKKLAGGLVELVGLRSQ